MKGYLKIKRVLALFLAMAMLLAMVGCSGGKSAEEQYSEELDTISSEIGEVFTDFSQQLPTLDPNDSTSLEKVEGLLDQMNETFRKLGDLEAPEKYRQVQQLLDESSDNALQGLEMIREELQVYFTGGNPSGNSQKLVEGTQLLLTASQKLQEAGEKRQEIEGIS